MRSRRAAGAGSGDAGAGEVGLSSITNRLFIAGGCITETVYSVLVHQHDGIFPVLVHYEGIVLWFNSCVDQSEPVVEP